MDNAVRLEAYKKYAAKCETDGTTPQPVEDYLLQRFKVEWCEELGTLEQFFCAQWQELRSDAPKGFGLSEIPYTSIVKWLDERQVPDPMRNYYHAVIRTIDRNWITYKDEEQQGKAKPEKPAKMQRGSVPKV